MNDAASGALLARFADFYEEVARLRLAMREGRLLLYLSAATAAVALSPADLAALVSQRLKARLEEHARHVALTGTRAQIESDRLARYVMATLADELMLLETDWVGRSAWQQCLLEKSLFGTTSAGSAFFEHLDRLLNVRAVGPLEEELAAVFLMSLRLGFKGQHGGAHGAPRLQRYNTRLIRLVSHGPAADQPSFIQAYQHRLTGRDESRLAPVSRWYGFGAVALGLYVLISTVVWVILTDRFNSVFGN